MKIVLEQGDKNEITKVAEVYGVDEEKLWDLYQAIMVSNFNQDLHDIARENEEELKGVYEWKN